MIDDDLLKKALSVYGSDAQKRMAIEECGEFIVALTQWERGRMSDLGGEVADVIIMMRQMQLMMGEDYINSLIDLKMNRLKERLAHKE